MGSVLWDSEDYRGMCLRILATETDDDARLSYSINCLTSTLSVTIFLRAMGLGQCK